VLNNCSVNACISSLLLGAGLLSFCPVTNVSSGTSLAFAVQDSSPMQRALQKGPPSFITAGRFEIVPPTHSLKLAEENEIAIHLLTPGVTKFLNTQIWYRGTDSTGEMRKEELGKQQ
jgi:hypothetical protein